MALARLSFTENGSVGDTLNCAISSCAAGDTLVACWRWHGTVTLVSATMSGETVAQIGSTQSNASPDNPNFQWLVVHNVSGSGTKTFTCVLTGAPYAAQDITVWRLTGAETAGANDGNPVSASGNSTTPTVNISNTVSPAAVFSVGISSGGDSTGYSFTSEAVANTVWYDFAQYTLNVGSPGSHAAGFTTGSGPWLTTALAIKESGAAAGVGQPTSKRLGGVPFATTSRGVW